MSQPARRGRTVLLVLAAFAGGLIFARPLTAGRFNPYQKLGVFTKVLSYIEGHYVEDLSETDLMYGAARGLTDVLDPHSRFMDPEEYGRLKKETEGNEEIEGIGIDVEKRKNRFVIISPIEGSPAARAGIEPGDVIKRVDGVEISTLEFDEAVARMQGPGGSEVTLVVERRNRELTFRIRRAKYEVKAVEGKLLEDGVALRQDARVRRGRRRDAGEAARSAVGKAKGTEGPEGAGAGPAPQSGRPARPGDPRRRSVRRRRADRQDRRQGRARDGRGQGAQPRHLVGLPDGRRRRRRDRVGGRDRRGRAAGSRPRGRARDADVRQGIGADGDRSRRLRRQAVRPQADGGALLHAQGAFDPGPGDHAQRRRGRDRAAGDPSDGDLPRERDLRKRLRTSRARSRRAPSAWTTTSCRWRSTTCARGRCFRSRPDGSRSAPGAVATCFR